VLQQPTFPSAPCPQRPLYLLQGYLHTVLCNSAFNATIINTDLHYITWDSPPQQHPRTLVDRDYSAMLASGAMFGRKFSLNASESLPLLERIDSEILSRADGEFSPGGWCSRADTESFSRAPPDPSWQMKPLRSNENEEQRHVRTKFLGVALRWVGPKPSKAPVLGTPAPGLESTNGSAASGEAMELGTALNDSRNEAVTEAVSPALYGRLTGKQGGNVEEVGDASQGVESAPEPDRTNITEEVGSTDRPEKLQNPGEGTLHPIGGNEEGDMLHLAEQVSRSQELVVEPGAAEGLGQGGLVEADLERLNVVHDPDARVGADVLGFGTEGREDASTEGLRSAQRSRKGRAERRLKEILEELVEETGHKERRGCDEFDGSYFLKPTNRVHALNELIESALQISGSGLCSMYHKEVVTKSSQASKG
jgi:hypothetical protein